MSEIPKHHTPLNKKKSSASLKRGKDKQIDRGIYALSDSTSFLSRVAVPVLADVLGAKQPTFRSLVGKYGDISRDASLLKGDGNRTVYETTIERISDTDRRGRLFARVALSVSITDVHILDDVELVTEWPLLEELGVANELIADSFNLHVRDLDTEDMDLDDPWVDAVLMKSQAEFIDDADWVVESDFEDDDDEIVDDDDESLSSKMYGQDVIRYFKKELRVSSDQQPTLTLKAGYETDGDIYPVSLGDAYRTKLIGDTFSEVSVLTQLNRESFQAIDSQLIEEFEDALMVLGILKRTRRRQ